MSNTENAYTGIMSVIASGAMDKSILNDAFTETNQAKMFLVAQAKNEMRRIVKLTTFLDSVEDRFMETANLLMQEYPDNLEIVQSTIETLMKCINRSNDLITAIVKDDKLNSFVFQNNDVEIFEDYKDITPESKDKIRTFASTMIDRLSQLEEQMNSTGENGETDDTEQ